jgi:hypothetical protein
MSLGSGQARKTLRCGWQSSLGELKMAIVDDFKSAVDAFNNRDWGGLSTFLDPTVIAFTVHGVQPVIGRDGSTGVIEYLKGDVEEENPHFVLIGDPQTSGGSVYGKACWTDPVAVEVVYHFTLKFSRQLQHFVIKTMYAPEDGTLCKEENIKRVKERRNSGSS